MSSLQQTIEITLVAVQSLTLHGSPYYDIHFTTAGNDAAQHLRINPEAFYADPQPGDRVAVNLLMGNIMGATRLA